MSASLRKDDSGAFPVLEAVLVAILIFTTILFFTGVGKPTDATEPGGLDLAQNAADILGILATREFSGVPMQDNATNSTDGWVTKIVSGNTAVRTEVDDLVSEIVPAGALYKLRLSNGHETLELAPGNNRTAHGARVAEMFVFPVFVSPQVAYPGLTAPAGNATGFAVYGLQLVVWFGA